MLFPTLLTLCATVLSPVTAADTRTETHVTTGPTMGGTGGYEFTDYFYTDESDHKRMASIVMSGCGQGEHVSEMLIGFRDNDSTDVEPDLLSSVHGSPVRSVTTIKLEMAKDEYINEIAAWTYGDGKNAMVGRLELSTNKHQHVSCGSHASDDTFYHFKPTSSALLHFSGRHDLALNMLQAHWILVEDF